MIRKNKKNIKFDLCDKEGIEAGIKIRENASEGGLGPRPREVRKYKDLGYEEWFKEKEYGIRWPSSEVIFSGVKTIFGEFVRSHKKRNMYKEAKLKFWACQKFQVTNTLRNF